VLKKYYEFKSASKEDREKCRVATYKKFNMWSITPASTASTNDIVTKLLKRLEQEFQDREQRYEDEDVVVNAYETIDAFAKQLTQPPE
jgi:hypothetical protein